jgi:thioredoxin-like negative regulator of GroEL
MQTVKITTTNDFNSLIKLQKKTGEKTKVLFVSDWDSPSQTLLNNLDKSELPNDLYIVDIWDLPRSTSIFNIGKIPSLVTIKDSYKVDDYLPRIYKVLGI